MKRVYVKGIGEMILPVRSHEEWRPVAGFEDRYLVSNFGNIKSLNYKSTKKPTNLKLRVAKNGYARIGLFNGKKQISFPVHRLVAVAFISPQPSPQHQINHKDGNKLNNYVGNLEWCTHAENTYHAIKTGLRYNIGQFHGNASLKKTQVKTIKILLAKKSMTQRRIAKYFNVCLATINHISTGRGWNHIKHP
jgi:hypothetical protein